VEFQPLPSISKDEDIVQKNHVGIELIDQTDLIQKKTE
jgi:hypothetical protein